MVFFIRIFEFFFLIFKYVFSFRKDKNKLFLRYFGIFTCVFCIMIRINGCFSIFTVYLLFFKQKNVGACSSCPSEWAALTPLKRRIWCFPVVKSGHLLSNWMRGRVLFHMMWRVQINNCWIAADDRLFMFFFLSSQLKCIVILFVCYLLNHACLSNLDSSGLA